MSKIIEIKTPIPKLGEQYIYLCCGCGKPRRVRDQLNGKGTHSEICPYCHKKELVEYKKL